MYNSQITEIKISEILPLTLDTRESATRLVNIIKQEGELNHKIELDFTGTIFMSRSFADQFHKDLYSEEQKLNLEIKNASFDIVEMLRIVSNTQTERKAIKASCKTLIFNNLESLEDFSFAW